ncbi:MAG: histidine phosphatase family protein [Synechococcus sp. MED-G71]|nr:MAG: histidine phosphatase family protein [Synechococcus sp. MED-G71]|tara:strand:+ start:3829 stop:4407 length:579 start_codon:yes stop_codon:yes gene_type:complete
MASTQSIWLLRHGATEWSRNGRHTGSSDIPLLPEGEEEARSLAPLLAGEHFARVWSSPLQRARRTCELAGLGDQADVMEGLREWDYGIYEGITTAEIRQSVPGWSVWSHGCPQGEDAAAVTRRCQEVIEQVVAIDGDVALFAHGHILRSLAGTWIGQGAVGGKHLILGTATTSVLGFERENRALKRWNAPCR